MVSERTEVTILAKNRQCLDYDRCSVFSEREGKHGEKLSGKSWKLDFVCDGDGFNIVGCEPTSQVGRCSFFTVSPFPGAPLGALYL